MKAIISEYNDYGGFYFARLTDGTFLSIKTDGSEPNFCPPDLSPHPREQQMNLTAPRWPEGAEL